MTDEKKPRSFAELFEAQARGQAPTQRRRIAVGDKIEVEIASIGTNAVFVDLDGKRQAFFEREEFVGPDGALGVKVGDRLAAFVVAVDGSSNVRLGRSAGRPAGLAAIEEARESGIAVEGKIAGTNKGGLEIDFSGVRAFCPMSQIDLHRVDDPAAYIGRVERFRVLEVKDSGRKIVVSRRAILEEEARENVERAARSLEPGSVVRGPIVSIRDFGAFVDLGGIEGLIPASELSHDRSMRPADLVKVGDPVEALVRDIKRDERGALKVTLSLKALAGDPWDAIDVVAPEGRVLAGTVMKVVEFGAFVRLAPGVEGLLHVSEIGGTKRPAEILRAGQSVHVAVLRVDRDAHRISLAPAPEGLAVGQTVKGTQLVVGSVVAGSVERVENFGVFVQLDGTKGRAGRGLVPNAELGVPRGADVRKLFPLGRRIDAAKVLEVGEGRMRLSIRAVLDDEERADYDGYQREVRASGGLGTLADLLKAKR